jgi:hypothetical protein
MVLFPLIEMLLHRNARVIRSPVSRRANMARCRAVSHCPRVAWHRLLVGDAKRMRTAVGRGDDFRRVSIPQAEKGAGPEDRTKAMDEEVCADLSGGPTT